MWLWMMWGPAKGQTAEMKDWMQSWKEEFGTDWDRIEWAQLPPNRELPLD